MENQYTHELIIKTRKIYGMEVLEQRNVINREFERIDAVKVIHISKDIKFLQVDGIMHLYGFKVEDGGFYDAMNNNYYPENDINLLNGTINKLSNEELTL